VRECIALLHDSVLQEHTNDTWEWLLNPLHGYSLRGEYRFLTTNDALSDREVTIDFWHKNIPSKVSLFAWRLLRNILPTKDNLARRSILQNDDLACVDDCGNAEMTHHLFIQCAFSDIIWQHVRVWLDIDCCS